MLERDPVKRITAREALKHAWVTADMLTPRPLSVSGDAAAIACERRLRLSAARRQANVEEMLRYMVMVRPSKQTSTGIMTSRAPHASVSVSVSCTQHAVARSTWMPSHR